MQAIKDKSFIFSGFGRDGKEMVSGIRKSILQLGHGPWRVPEHRCSDLLPCKVEVIIPSTKVLRVGETGRTEMSAWRVLPSELWLRLYLLARYKAMACSMDKVIAVHHEVQVKSLEPLQKNFFKSVFIMLALLGGET